MAKGKTIAVILGVFVALGLVCAGVCGGVFYMAYKGYKTADATVSPRLEVLFKAIDDGAFADTYDTETTPALRQNTTREQYAATGVLISERLGRLQSKTLVGFNMRQENADSYVEATYTAVFEKGAGTITANMHKINGEWKFDSFGVDSPVLNAIQPTAEPAAEQEPAPDQATPEPTTEPEPTPEPAAN